MAQGESFYDQLVQVSYLDQLVSRSTTSPWPCCNRDRAGRKGCLVRLDKFRALKCMGGITGRVSLMPSFATRMVCKVGDADTIGTRVCVGLGPWYPGLFFVSLVLVSLVQKSGNIQYVGP